MWYKGLTLPPIAPSGFVIGIIWTIIFILTAISAIKIWDAFHSSKRNKSEISHFYSILGLYITNAFLNAGWSFLFFTKSLILASIIEMVVLNLTVAMLIFFNWRFSKLASYLLIPYFVWVCFATALAIEIWLVN